MKALTWVGLEFPGCGVTAVAGTAVCEGNSTGALLYLGLLLPGQGYLSFLAEQEEIFLSVSVHELCSALAASMATPSKTMRTPTLMGIKFML